MASAILLLLLISLAVQINCQGSMIEEATVATTGFTFEEATVASVKKAFRENRLTSRQLVNYYLDRINTLNSSLRGVIEVNPDALKQADLADLERVQRSRRCRSSLHGIPVLIKDNINTKDKLNTTSGSYALLGAVVPRDAGVITRLRAAGAVILGKASMSEWSGFRSVNHVGWCPRSGQGMNPYFARDGDPCGSSSGSAISVSGNMALVSLGTQSMGSGLTCPADYNSVVAIQPTVGLTSRAGMIRFSPRQDTVGPICRTVADAVYVLDTIVGYDARDIATKKASRFIPPNGYIQFLKKDGLRGKRLGVVRNPFNSIATHLMNTTFDNHLQKMREMGATVIDNLEIPNIDIIQDRDANGLAIVLPAEFKLSLNGYLNELISSPVRSLSDVLEFNKKNPHLEETDKYPQAFLIRANSTNGIGVNETLAIKYMKNLTRDGFVKIIRENCLDGILTLGANAHIMIAMGGFPAISVPAGFDSITPFGILFSGLRGSEPKLIEIAYGFEQATLARRKPDSTVLKPIGLSTM